MIILFGDVVPCHGATSFLAQNLVGYVEMDLKGSDISAGSPNQVVSTDISDKRYMCDTPLSQDSGGCGCAVGGKGLVGSDGRTFPGSSINANGTTTAVAGPMGFSGVNKGVPHPAFRFDKKVTDVTIRMKDISIPGKERDVWNQRFRLTGPDGSLGSDYLPSSLPALPDDGVFNTPFHKLCAAVNSYRKYMLHVEAGGEAPITGQKIVFTAKIIQPPEMIDPAKAGNSEGGEVDGTGSMKATGPRLFVVDGKSPAGDSAPAIRSSSFADTTSFACRYEATASPGPNTYLASKSLLSQPQIRGFPAVTATSFSGEDDQCCQCNAAPKNAPGCHKPPTVTIHFPRNDWMTNNFF